MKSCTVFECNFTNFLDFLEKILQVLYVNSISFQKFSDFFKKVIIRDYTLEKNKQFKGFDYFQNLHIHI